MSTDVACELDCEQNSAAIALGPDGSDVCAIRTSRRTCVGPVLTSVGGVVNVVVKCVPQNRVKEVSRDGVLTFC